MRPALGCVVLAFACATAQHHPHAARPVAHSSIDAVLLHGSELALTEAQRATLEALDAQEREQVRALRELPRVPPPGAGGRRHRDSMYVGGGERQLQARQQRRFRIDEIDNAAYVQAEAALDESQRTRARQLASEYRAQLADFRLARDEDPDGD